MGYKGGLRGVIAVWLALLFTAPSLLAAALPVIWPGASDSACCRTKVRCCCLRHHGDDQGPAIVSQTCSSGCSMATLGPSTTVMVVSGYGSAWSLKLARAGAVLPVDPLQPARPGSHDLLQRPPPSSCFES